MTGSLLHLPEEVLNQDPTVDLTKHFTKDRSDGSPRHLSVKSHDADVLLLGDVVWLDAAGPCVEGWLAFRTWHRRGELRKSEFKPLTDVFELLTDPRC